MCRVITCIEHRYRQLPDVLVNVTLILALRHKWPRQLRCSCCVEDRTDVVRFVRRVDSRPVRTVSYDGLRLSNFAATTCIPALLQTTRSVGIDSCLESVD
jgi:hypothetical protein